MLSAKRKARLPAGARVRAQAFPSSTAQGGTLTPQRARLEPHAWPRPPRGTERIRPWGVWREAGRWQTKGDPRAAGTHPSPHTCDGC